MEARGYGEYERMDPALLPKVYVAYRTSLSEGTEVSTTICASAGGAAIPEVVGAMETWAGYAEEGRACLLQRRLRAPEASWWTPISTCAPGSIGSTAATWKWCMRRGRPERRRTSPGSGGAIVGTYEDEAMFGKAGGGDEASGCGSDQAEDRGVRAIFPRRDAEALRGSAGGTTSNELSVFSLRLSVSAEAKHLLSAHIFFVETGLFVLQREFLFL